MLKINEIFSSIQGEGSLAGTAATFVRFSGCNLSCKWCDTNFKYSMNRTIESVVESVNKYPARLVVITGGEPTLQMASLYKLVNELSDIGYIVALETNGTRHIEPNRFDHITVSPKEFVELLNVKHTRNCKTRMQSCSDLKLIYEGRNKKQLDYWIEKIDAAHYYLQPLSNSKESIEACVNYVRSQSIWKLSLQIHKIVNIQ